jgi:hypothetical protein
LEELRDGGGFVNLGKGLLHRLFCDGLADPPLPEIAKHAGFPREATIPPGSRKVLSKPSIVDKSVLAQAGKHCFQIRILGSTGRESRANFLSRQRTPGKQP